MNATRRKQLLELDYSSPFRLGIIPFFSMPSTPSAEPWTGVAGVRKLFGTKVFKLIQDAERQKHAKIIREFMPSGGNVLIFQKDAYNTLKNPEAPEYSRDSTIKGTLISDFDAVSKVKLFGVPPTRSLNGGKAQQTLKNILNNLSSKE